MENKWNFNVVSHSNALSTLCILEGTQILSFKEVFNYWKTSPEFTNFYVKSINSIGYEAFFWEHPAVNLGYLNSSYEVSLKKTFSFNNIEVDCESFSKYIQAKSFVEVFKNLGKDAILVVPTEQSEQGNYVHFGKFLRKANDLQIRKVFSEIGKSTLLQIESGQTVWLNTEGTGVIWVHVRLDSKPKYYKKIDYKAVDYLENI